MPKKPEMASGLAYSKKHKFNIYYEGDSKVYTKEELEAKYRMEIKKYCGSDEEKYRKTVTMHRAFTAIALDRIEFPGKDPDNRTCKVYRGVRQEVLSRFDPEYDQKVKGTGDTITTPHNMGESTSIEKPLDGFIGPENDIHEFNVPFARVLAPYFLYLFDDEGNVEPNPRGFWTQREFVCDLSDLPAEVTRKKQ
jgi:hypothetical protein